MQITSHTALVATCQSYVPRKVILTMSQRPLIIVVVVLIPNLPEYHDSDREDGHPRFRCIRVVGHSHAEDITKSTMNNSEKLQGSAEGMSKVRTALLV